MRHGEIDEDNTPRPVNTHTEVVNVKEISYACINKQIEILLELIHRTLYFKRETSFCE